MRRVHIFIASIAIGLLAFGIRSRVNAQPAATQPADELDVAPDSALLEVVPPQWIRHAADPLPLWQMEMRKQMIGLRDRSRLRRISASTENRSVRDAVKAALESPEKALHVRIVPGTALIEFSVDRSVALEQAGEIAETIVNQLLEDERQIAQSSALERSVQLNNLKQKYQFKVRDLQTEIREKMVRLEVGAPATQKSDQADAYNQQYQLETAKDELQTTRELLAQVTRALDKLSEASQSQTEAAGQLRWFRKPNR